MFPHTRLRRASRLVAAAAAVLGFLSPASSVAAAPPHPVDAAAPPAPQPAGSTFSFEGGGFGHGVGMSQFGARAQASAGRSEAQILGFYYPGTAISAASPPGPIVLLPQASCSGIAAAPSTTLAPAGGPIQIFVNGPSYGGEAGLTAVQAPDSATISITGNSGAYYRLQAPGFDWSFGTPSDFLVVALNGVPTGLGMNNTRYNRGRLVIADNGAGAIGQPTALNAYAQDMTMQEYLYGLAEVPSSWPAETLRAQAIAGRTYAERVAAPRRNAGSRFHLYGSTLDQCYRGYEKEGEAGYGGYWTSAVDATNGQVVTYGGELAQTFYSSSNGGHSERSGYAFSQDLPYLIAQPDPWDNHPSNSLFRWTRSFDGDTLGGKIGGVGRVTNVSISGPIGASGRINKATVTVTGSGGTRSITGSQLRSMLGLPDTLVFRIRRDGCVIYGPDTACGNTLPAGSFDSVTVSGAGAVVGGWAADPDTSSSVEIDVWVNGAFAGFGYANTYRPDVGQAYPAYGSNRGFSFWVPVPTGTSSVCAYAIDVNVPSQNRGLGCRSVTRTNHPPFGSYEAITRVPGGAEVQGWAIDPDTSAPIDLHAYANGRLVGYGTAAHTRPDIGAAFPGYGSEHGFTFRTSLPSGPQSVCVYAIDWPGGPNPTLGCRSIDVSPVPIGNLDGLVRSGDTVSAQGWALDPDVAGSIEVHVLVDGAFAGWGYANLDRPDIGAAFPRYGSNHGFAVSVPVAPGGHTVCVYGLNTAAGTANRFLGCQSL